MQNILNSFEKTFKTSYQGNEYTFQVLGLLSEQGKFKIYKVAYGKYYFALKDFGTDTAQFEREARFQQLSHENLLTPVLASEGYMTYSTNENFKFILTQFCPNGDLFTLLVEKEIQLEEKLARTYFRRLVEAVEYMHNSKTAHLDIKLCNILLDEDYDIKLADFDLSSFEGDGKFEKGTENFRAPEVIRNSTYDIYKADVFSLGVVLFQLLVGKYCPFYEVIPKIQRMLYEKPEEYWIFIKSKALAFKGEFSNSFKILFEGMTKENPEKRYSIQDVKESSWYNEEIYSDGDLKTLMANLV